MLTIGESGFKIRVGRIFLQHELRVFCLEQNLHGLGLDFAIEKKRNLLIKCINFGSTASSLHVRLPGRGLHPTFTIFWMNWTPYGCLVMHFTLAPSQQGTPPNFHYLLDELDSLWLFSNALYTCTFPAGNSTQLSLSCGYAMHEKLQVCLWLSGKALYTCTRELHNRFAHFPRLNIRLYTCTFPHSELHSTFNFSLVCVLNFLGLFRSVPKIPGF